MAETYQKIEQERNKLRREFAVLAEGVREVSVTRYNFEVASQFKITDQIVYVEARPSKNGKYVRYLDYLKLKEAARALLADLDAHAPGSMGDTQDALAALVGEEGK